MVTVAASRLFALDVYPPEVRNRLPHSLTNGVRGSEWAMGYYF